MIRGDARAWLRTRSAQYALLFVAFAAVAPYALSLTFGFVYDDRPIIADNDTLHGWGALASTWVHPYWPAQFGSGAGSQGLFRPVTQFVFALLWNAGRGSALPFHAWAVALHVAGTLGVCALLMRAVPRWVAVGGALLFAVHPVHVEAVASIVGSAEIAVAIGAIGACLILWRAESRDDASGAIGWGTAIAFGAVVLAALGAKESAALVPAIALVWWWGWRVPDEARRPGIVALARHAWRVWVATAIAIAAMMGWRALVLGRLRVADATVAFGLRDMSVAHRAATMLAAWPTVAKLLVWPSRLTMHYGPSLVPPHTALATSALASLAVVALVCAAAFELGARGDRRPLAAIAWIALAYLPASNLLVPTGQLVAERTLYAASIGAVMLAAWGAARLAPLVRATPLRALVAAAVVGIAALGGWTAAASVPRWQTSYTLFVSGIDADPKSARPFALLGSWYLEQGKRERGTALIARAHELEPADVDLSLLFAKELLALHRPAEALVVLGDATRRDPRSAELRANYIAALSAARGPAAVIADIERVGASDPLRSARHLVVARAWRALGQRDSALAAYRAGVAESPRDAALRFVYAGALLDGGFVADAARELAVAKSSGALPVAPRALLAARIALATGDSAGARTAIAEAHAAAPTDTTIGRLAQSIGARE